MPHETLIAAPGPRDRTVLVDGRVLDVPAGWALLPPGDAGLTRRVKAAGPSWTVKEKRGRREFSRGVWAPEEHIVAARRALERTRATPEYRKKLAAGRRRRDKEQQAYVRQFERSVAAFLAFAPSHAELQTALARAVAEHATPVGSGTVARTKRIPVEQRAEAAVIAWMRHQTTAYDDMRIERRKGRRREVRRELATRSRALLRRYRRGEHVDDCPLARALADAERPLPAPRAPAPPPEAPAAPPRRATATPRPPPLRPEPASPTPVEAPPTPAPAPPVAAQAPTPEPTSREATLAAIRRRARRRGR